jgi:hypothetical protein
VGALRLLKNDPFYELLARNQWLKVLDPDYQEEIRGILMGTLPRKAPPCRKSSPSPCSPRFLTQPLHPGLFEGLGAP